MGYNVQCPMMFGSALSKIPDKLHLAVETRLHMLSYFPHNILYRNKILLNNLENEHR